ncbi:DUF559 domain-containing protein [Paenibacillus cremeus]|uniref:DUF559 domain-containing protein n=1 Tax=Paenibacillus cremeus TaxID=2163881 RepID=A0A559JKD4_9BACL|nr:DUF559 domain-containing protein [Paenibacillus cremeus]TVY00347.1 DUF559 domain-containing protein [Paenibacillus cremeus]
MHPNLTRYIEQLEKEAVIGGAYPKKLGRPELMFLQEVWGPVFNYQYDGLQAEYPFKDFKEGQRFVDFVYVKGGMKLLIEIDGFTTHARDISPGEFDDHLLRQNDLVLSGWLVLRFSAHLVEKQPQQCQKQIKQAIGHWWSLTKGELTTEDADVWRLRRNLLVQMAAQRNGSLKPRDVADAFQVTSRAAVNWLKRFQAEGVFTGETSKQQRTTRYILQNTFQ